MPTTVKIQPLAAGAYENTVQEAFPTGIYQNPNPMLVTQAANARRWSFVQFWLDQIPVGAQILQAKFGFYVVSATTPLPIRVYKVVDAWYNDSVNWNNKPFPGTTPIIEIVDSATAYEIDVTEIVREWMDDIDWNLGFCLTTNPCEDGSISITGSSSNDPTKAPYLEITYAGGLVSNMEIWELTQSGSLAAASTIWKDVPSLSNTLVVPGGQTWRVIATAKIAGYVAGIYYRAGIRAVINGVPGGSGWWQSAITGGEWGTAVDVFSQDLTAGSYIIKAQYNDDGNAIQAGYRSLSYVAVKIA